MEAILDVERIVKELRRERERLDRAITALEESDGSGTASNVRTSAQSNARGSTQMSAPQNGQGPGRHLTPAGRKRLSEAMKKRWAERRKTKS